MKDSAYFKGKIIDLEGFTEYKKEKTRIGLFSWEIKEIPVQKYFAIVEITTDIPENSIKFKIPISEKLQNLLCREHEVSVYMDFEYRFTYWNVKESKNQKKDIIEIKES